MHAVRADFNSPILDTADVDPDLWTREAPMHGIDFDLDAQLRLLQERVVPYMGEFQPQERTPDAHGYYAENPWYAPMDAHVLYGLVRDVKPRRLIELGSGFSTAVIVNALAANDSPCDHTVIDPFPSSLVGELSDRLELRTEGAEEVDAALFSDLGAGDILFIDTSHVVKPGSDVVKLVLEVLPTLSSGVIVHIHDFYRPFEYPRMLYEEFHVNWQEHYLVQAFLAYNPNYRVVCANHALWRLRRAEVLPMFSRLREGMEPSALWIERT